LQIHNSYNMENSTLQQHQALQDLNILETEFYVPFIKSFEGFSHREIAYILELPLDIVRLRIKLARKALNYRMNTLVSDNRVLVNN